MYHYEYAIHNVDNHRGGATLRVPIDAGAVASNFSFRDIDGNALNDWSAARVGNEVVFTAPSTNALNWNTIYNFGFDANFAPGNSAVQIDEARLGPGNLFVTVGAKAPSGSTYAQVTSVGHGCGGGAGCYNSFYESSFDLANSGFTMTPTPSGYTVGSLTGAWITPAGSTLTLTDDSGTLQAIPFALPFMGSSTNNLWICSNGFVSTASNGTSFTPSPAAFLGGQPTWAALWRDLNPGTGGQVRFDATASRVVVSFVAVPNFSGGGTVTFQWQFQPNGVVHVVYQAVSGTSSPLVGWSRGGNAADPGPIDISAALPGGFSLCHPGHDVDAERVVDVVGAADPRHDDPADGRQPAGEQPARPVGPVDHRADAAVRPRQPADAGLRALPVARRDLHVRGRRPECVVAVGDPQRAVGVRPRGAHAVGGVHARCQCVRRQHDERPATDPGRQLSGRRLAAELARLPVACPKSPCEPAAKRREPLSRRVVRGN